MNAYRFPKEILLMVQIESDFMKFGQRSLGYYMYKLGWTISQYRCNLYVLDFDNTKVQLKIQSTSKT